MKLMINQTSNKLSQFWQQNVDDKSGNNEANMGRATGCSPGAWLGATKGPLLFA